MSTMAPERPAPAADALHSRERDITAVPRAVIMLSARLIGQLQRALIDEREISTARGNAWDAVCADRARASARAELRERLHRRA